MLCRKGRTYMIWFWLFWFYSFLGYLLERMFAKVVRSERQVRKCFLLLPCVRCTASPWWCFCP